MILLLILQIVMLYKQKNSNSFDNLQDLKIVISQERETIVQSVLQYLKMSSDNDFQNSERLIRAISEKFNDLERRIEQMTKSNEFRLDSMRTNLNEKIVFMQKSNKEELQQMRYVVDEKLNQTLETRLNKSFEIINSRLEAVYKGLGEMQGLAKGVGDLKNVLTNVKTRGTFGEVQLSMLLEQILAPEQFAKNVAINPITQERVDFAIKMPGKDVGCIYLPIDAKFPMEDYYRLIDAEEKGDLNAIAKSIKDLESRITDEAKKISLKYIVPPYSTDFAIMYFPVEGLYAEALKRTTLIENLQRKHKIIICGPTTLAALLNSLQMGFKTLAIEKRSSEMWQLLSVFKTEFGKFTDLIGKTQKKIFEVSDTLEDAAKKTRTIQRKLKEVSEISGEESENLLGTAEI